MRPVATRLLVVIPNDALRLLVVRLHVTVFAYTTTCVAVTSPATLTFDV